MTKLAPTSKSVAGVIFTENNSQILLVKRRDVNIWVIPGGGVDPGETPEEAIIREFKEETGLHVKIKKHVGLYTPINRLSNHSYLYECVIEEGTPTLSDETRDIGFFPLLNLPSPIFFLHVEWIKDAALHLPQLIEKPLSQITYYNLVKYFFSHPIQVIRIAISRLGLPINTN